MSENQWWMDEPDEDVEPEPASAAQNPRDLRSQLKAALKKNKELSDQLGTAQAEARKSNIGNYFRDKGINPKLAKYVPADLDPTSDALDKWVAEDGELFNIVPKADGDANKPPGTGDGTSGTPAVPDGNVAPNVQAAWNAINGSTGNALPAGKMEDLEAAINGAADEATLRALLFSHGAGSF